MWNWFKNLFKPVSADLEHSPEPATWQELSMTLETKPKVEKSKPKAKKPVKGKKTKKS